jgi:hypothetical protein
VEIVENGNAILAGASRDRIVKDFYELIERDNLNYPPLFGDGKASYFICEKLLELI